MSELKLSNVRKSFGTAVILEDINLEIADGEFIVFVGPSGCGKSTLLRFIAGLDEVSGGEISIGGKIVNDVAPARRGVAMVFQSYALYPHMTVYQNMSFGLRLAKLDAAGDRRGGALGRSQAAHRAPARQKAEGAVRRPEAARCHRPRHRSQAEGIPVR